MKEFLESLLGEAKEKFSVEFGLDIITLTTMIGGVFLLGTYFIWLSSKLSK